VGMGMKFITVSFSCADVVIASVHVEKVIVHLSVCQSACMYICELRNLVSTLNPE